MTGGPGIAEGVAARVDALRGDLDAWRRDLHRHAETAWTEFRTSAVIAGHLEALGLEVALGRAVLEPDARMGVPPPEVLDRLELLRDLGPATALYDRLWTKKRVAK